MGFADILIGIFGVVLATNNLNLSWNFKKMIIFIIFIISGSIIEYSIFWIASTISFWKVRAGGIFPILYNLNGISQKYPASAFGKWYKVLITGFIPIAFINYYPVIYIIGKSNSGEHAFMSYISPIVAAIMLCVGYFMWVMGIKNYSSSGS
jgi:ABC-2 type transport system permease protein